MASNLTQDARKPKTDIYKTQPVRMTIPRGQENVES